MTGELDSYDENSYICLWSMSLLFENIFMKAFFMINSLLLMFDSIIYRLICITHHRIYFSMLFKNTNSLFTRISCHMLWTVIVIY